MGEQMNINEQADVYVIRQKNGKFLCLLGNNNTLEVTSILKAYFFQTYENAKVYVDKFTDQIVKINLTAKLTY